MADNGMPKALIISDESDLAGIYRLYMTDTMINVVGLSSFSESLSVSRILNPDLVVACVSSSPSHLPILKSLRGNLLSARFVVLGNLLSTPAFDFLMKLGLAGYIDRKDSHPKDLQYLIKQLFFQGSL